MSDIDFVIPRVPATHWLFRNFNAMSRGRVVFFEKIREKYGNLVDMNITPWIDFYLVTDPDLVKYILLENNKNYKKGFAYDFLKQAIGNGLLTNEGESWFKHRRIAQPAFHREKLANLAESMTDCIHKMLVRWQSFDSKTPINIAKEFMTLTCEIAARSLFSSDLGELKDEITNHIAIINELVMEKIATPVRMPLWVPTNQNILFNNTVKKLDKIIYNLIETRRKADHPYYDLLTMFMDAKDEETGEGMSDEELRDEVMTLFLAGTETSSTALSWTFYLLAQYPEVKNQMYEEIKSTLGDQAPNAENILKLKYTSMVIQESMRLYPPVWVVSREALKEDRIRGNKITKRAQMYISIFTIHRNPELWEDPEKFDPLRFTPAKNKERHKYAYMPFGAGPRGCMGNNFAIMEITIAMALIVQQNLHLRLTDRPVELEPVLTLRPKEGLWMTLSNNNDEKE